MNSSLVLIVKNPSGGVKDFNITIDSSCTVRNLKQLLQKQYPNNPAEKKQKLIHAGKLLEDEDMLSTVFKTSNNPQIIHLVVSKQHTQTAPVNNMDDSFNQIPNLQQQQFLQQQFLEQQRLAAQHFVQMQQEQQQRFAHPPPLQQQERHESPLWLIIKLMFMVYLFSQGGSFSRTAFLSIGAFLIYLYQTGLLRVTTIFAQGGNAPNLPPGQRGVMAELILPFFYSLIPTWQPDTRQEAPPVPQPPAAPVGNH